MAALCVGAGKLRMEGGKPYVTDNDNYIVDLYFTSPIKDANKAGKEIAEVKTHTHTLNRKRT